MKKYFLYRLKQCIKPFILLFVFGMIIYVLPISVHDYTYWNKPSLMPENYPDYFATNVDLYSSNIIVGLAIMSVATPIYMFYYRMNRRSVDMYYSLPITRTKIFITQFVAGLLCVFTAYTLSYWIGFIAIVVKVRNLKYYYYIFGYLASLVPMFTVYSISTFLFTRANTVLDGLITLAGGFFVGSAILAGMASIAENLFRQYFFPAAYLDFTPFGALESISPIFKMVYKKDPILWIFDPSVQYRYFNEIFELTGGILFTILGVAAALYMLKTEKISRAENCGQVTESLFSYKTLIPVYAISLSIWLCSSPAALAVIGFAGIVATIVWRRTFKIGKNRAILLAVFIVIAIAAALLVEFLPPFVDLPTPVYTD